MASPQMTPIKKYMVSVSNVTSANQTTRESSYSLNMPYFGSIRSFKSSMKNSLRTPPASSASSPQNFTLSGFFRSLCLYWAISRMVSWTRFSLVTFKTTNWETGAAKANRLRKFFKNEQNEHFKRTFYLTNSWKSYIVCGILHGVMHLYDLIRLQQSCLCCSIK